MQGTSFKIDPTQDLALIVKNATFEWEETPMEKEHREKEKKSKKGIEIPKVKGTLKPPVGTSKPFQMRGVNMSVQRGTLVAVVGPVGSGKVHPADLHTSPLNGTNMCCIYPVKPSTRSHWRDEENPRRSLLWWPRGVLPTNRVDPERDPRAL